jgi:hypothetical protein
MEPPKLDFNSMDEISRKKYLARIAMEGEDEKRRREAEEKLAREKQAAAETARQKELDKKAAEERVIKDKKDQEERERRMIEQASATIRGEIERIRTTGGKVETIRTLRNDMDEMIKEQNVTFAKIAIEEEARKRKTEATRVEQKKYNWAIIIASSLFLIGGLGLLFYLYTRPEESVIPPPGGESPALTKNIIVAEVLKNLSISDIANNDRLVSIKKTLAEENVPNGTILKVVITSRDTNGVVAEIKPQDFFEVIRAAAPGDIIRSVGNNMMLAVANTMIGARGGMLIFKVDSYQNAFAGMLRWEQGTLVRDIYELINSRAPEEALFTKPFEDIVFENQDTRALKNSEGRIVLLYGFLNKTTLAIAGDTDIFREILNRFRNSPSL